MKATEKARLRKRFRDIERESEKVLARAATAFKRAYQKGDEVFFQKGTMKGPSLCLVLYTKTCGRDFGLKIQNYSTGKTYWISSYDLVEEQE